MIKLLWSGIVMLLLVSGCGWNGTPTRDNDFTPLTSIKINADSPTIAAHTSTTLSVQGNASGLFTRPVTDKAVWTSSAPDVAGFVTATSPNRVTALKSGTAILTATVGSVSATFSLTVSSATISTVTITPATPSIFMGLTTQLTANGTFSDGTTQDLTFDAAWASDTPTVATVSNTVSSKGFVQTAAVGSTTISATFDGTSGTMLLTVTEPVLQSITVTPANPSLLTLSTKSFTATGNYSDGSTPDLTAQVAWSSSNTSFATITPTGGVATTLSQGTTSISASLGNVTGSSNLKVTGGNLTLITINQTNVTLVKDTVSPITATGTFSNGSSRDISGAVTWSPANTSIVTVSPSGGNLELLNPVAVTPTPTPTTITAKSGTVTAATPLTLTVVAPQLASIALSTTVLDLTAGTSSPLTAIATFSDNRTQDVTAIADWTSRADTIATVGTSGHAAGRVAGVAPGSTTISATYTNNGKTVSVPVPATVTVRQRTILSLTITPSNVTIGYQVPFTATAIYSDGSVVVTEDTEWKLDNSNVAILADSVNQPGQVVGVDNGTATLTATFKDKSQTATITVTGP